MGDFIRFARRYWLGSAVAVVASALALYGTMSDALDLYRAGLPGWLWQAVGLGLFFIATGYMLFAIERGRSSGAPAPAPKPGQSVEDRALIAMQAALQGARVAMSQGFARYPRAIPSMRAALLTAHKVFGIQLPPPREDGDVLELADARRLLEQVHPLLLEGHIEEARERAREIAEQLAQAIRKPAAG